MNRVAVVLLLASLSFATAAAAAETSRETLVIRIGYTTFDNTEKVQADLRSVLWYLSEITRKSKDWQRPLQFDLVLGNYYQVWSWFKTGQIDAAIVSPFMAMLLERDSQALSVLEFSEGTNPAAHFPAVATTASDSGNPIKAVDHYLHDLLVAAGKGEVESTEVRDEIQKIRKNYRFDLVSHLSSSGFIMPALYAQDWLTKQKGDGLTKQKDGKLPEVQKCRFWRLFFSNMHLTFAHDKSHAETATTLKFGYLSEDPLLAPFGPWVKYAAGELPDDVPSIPNDVLIVRQQTAEDALGPGGLVRERLTEQFMSDEIQTKFKEKGGKYTEIHWFNTSIQNTFRREVSQIFGSDVKNDELTQLNTRWYEKGLFDFTIDETLTFLRQDQYNSGISRLALVLSGGGVKSLYQTVLLDDLYGYRTPNLPAHRRVPFPPRRGPSQLRNCDPTTLLRPDMPASGPCDKTPPPRTSEPIPLKPTTPLAVHTMIGTSGGAMLAFFAAQNPQIGPLRNIVWSTSSKPLFANTDLPRLLSLLGMLLVVLIVLLAVKVFNVWGYRDDASAPLETFSVPKVVVIGLLLVLLGAAAIVVTRDELMESVPFIEASFFVLTGIAVHFGITCIARDGVGSSPGQIKLGKLAELGLGFGVLLLVVAGVARFFVMPAPEAFHGFTLPELSTLASAGIFLITAALIALASTGRWGLAVENTDDYVAGFAAAFTILVVAFLLLILLAQAGLGSLLELTGPYWWQALLTAIAAPWIVLYAARRIPRLHYIQRGLAELIRDRRGVLTTTLMTTFVGVFAFCIACWLLLVAPAVYSNVFAVKAFSEALPQEKLWMNHFHSNLIVTGTLLHRQNCPLDDIKEDGLYFCFEGPEGCGAAGGGAWQVFKKPAAARAVDAVFASGSAFPVFPPHRVHLPSGCEVPLVDGGYAHNVPLEAASKAEARQVLILNASPDPRDAVIQTQPAWRRLLQQVHLDGGGLIRSSPDVISFMFERAQELDRNIGESLVVASLSPRPEDGWWPFLLDFSLDVRNKMIAAAEQDIQQERRIGHILSWGRPVLLPRQFMTVAEPPGSPRVVQQSPVQRADRD